MTAAIIRQQRKIVSEKKIPECLIYEMADDLPIYYRGYEEVIKGRKQTEEIMGSSFIQSLIISRLFRFLIGELPEMYEILTNEIGLWFSKNSWRAADIAIYPKEKLKGIPLHNKYLDIPPKVVIEVDTKADLDKFTASADYYHKKTDALLMFGVEKIIWIFTDSRKVMIAESGKIGLSATGIPSFGSLTISWSILRRYFRYE
ncbi:MAG: Uma2 family endonuclease [Desulfobacteraceae bacterium]|nr:Uma2 family endonuclease [Desulfobacteraceae bacterium]